MTSDSAAPVSTLGLAAISGCFAASASVFGKLGMSAEDHADGTVGSSGSSSGGSSLNFALFGVEVREKRRKKKKERLDSNCF